MDENLEEESEIALNLARNINKKEFLCRDIKSLDRIIKKFFDIKKRDPKEEKQVINFLFNYLDLKGKEASILFSHIKNSPEYYNIIKRLHNDYQDNFEFSVVNPILFQSSFHLIKTNEQLIQKLTISIILLTIFVFLSSFLYFQRNKLNTCIQFYQQQLNQYSHIKEKYEKTSKKLEKEIETNRKLLSNLTSLQIQYETVIYSKQQFCEEMNSYKQNLEGQMAAFKNKIQIEISSLKEKQQNNDLNVKQRLELEIQKNQKLETDLSVTKQKLEKEIQNTKQLEDELKTTTTKLKDKGQKNEKNQKIENESQTIKQDVTDSFEKANKNQTATIFSNNNDNDKIKSGTNLRIILLLVEFLFTAFAFYNSYKNSQINLILSILAFIYDEMIPFFSLINYYTPLIYSICTFFFIFILFYLSRVINKFRQSYSIVYLIINLVCKYYLIIPNEIDAFDIFNAINSIIVILVVFFVIYNYRFSINDINLILMLKTIIFLFENNFDYSTVLIPNASFILAILLLIYCFFVDENGVDKKGILGMLFYTLLKYYIFVQQPNGKFYNIFAIFVIIFEFILIVIFINDYFSCFCAFELIISIFYLSVYWYLFLVFSIIVCCFSIVIYGIVFDQYNDIYIKIALVFLFFESLIKYLFLIYQTWQNFN